MMYGGQGVAAPCPIGFKTTPVTEQPVYRS